MTCQLCDSTLPINPIQDHFCCSGCHLVYEILKEQKVTNPKTHPLFKEALASGMLTGVVQQQVTSEERAKVELEVNGMWCHYCSKAIELLLLRQKGVIGVSVDYLTDLAVVEFDPTQTDLMRIVEFIRRIGYRASEFTVPGKEQTFRSLWLRFGITVFCALNVMMFAYPLYSGKGLEGYAALFGYLSFGLATLLMSYSAWPIWRRLVVSCRSRLIGMETLVLLGTVSAYCLSTVQLFKGEYHHLYYDSLAMVMTFVLFGNLLEKKMKVTAKERLFHLARLMPQKVRLETGEEIPVKEVTIKQRLQVLTGERIAFDGKVVAGDGMVDTSALTGEITPVRASTLQAGMVLVEGTIVYEVEDIKGVMGRLLGTIEHHLKTRSQTTTVLDRFLMVFVPFVALLALLTGSLSVLVIACPCAIGIALPLVEGRLVALLAKQGVCVSRKEALSRLAENLQFVFDKTGTLTQGKLRPTKEITSRTIIGLASYSSHPISRALANGKGETFDRVEQHIGEGLIGWREGVQYALGSKTLFMRLGIPLPAYQKDQTVTFFAKEKQCLEVIYFEDPMRENLPPLKGMILSGDQEQKVAALAKRCNMVGIGECDPLKKRDEILKLKRPVAMVGDGINDAAAMAVADLSIALSTGSEIAKHVADIVVTPKAFGNLPQVMQLAKKGKRVAKQNLFWAFIYNGIGLSLAALGVLTPLMAAAAMVLSSLSVVLNTFRIQSNK